MTTYSRGGGADIHVRIAGRRDAESIQAFLQRYWKKHHALAVSLELLDWQHWDARRESYGYVLAQRAGTDELLGLLGFVPTSQFDHVATASDDYWLAIWKVREDVRAPGLGIELLEHFKRERAPLSIGAIAIGPPVVPIYKALGFKIGQLEHFFVQNPLVNHPGLMVPGPLSAVSTSRLERSRIRELTASDFASSRTGLERLCPSTRVPAKGVGYFGGRFLAHPLYRYRLFVVDGGRGPIGAAVYRQVEANGARALRIVDVMSESGDLEFLGALTHELLLETGAEYGDLYAHGLDASSLRRGGFRSTHEVSGAVVPNHFEPFERRNVRIDFAYWLKKEDIGPYTIVKGDSDLDRPNVLPFGIS